MHSVHFNSDHYPRVLLLGNGINQCYNKRSWEAVLEALRDRFNTKDVCVNGTPFALQAIMLTGNDLNEGSKVVSRMMMDSDLSSSQRQMLELLLEIQFDAILTTNYSYELEQSIMPNWSPISTKYLRHTDRVTRAEGKYALHTFNALPYKTADRKIWHIHGEARKPSSIVLGHEYYGNLIGKYSEYIKLKRYYHAGIPDKAIKLDSWLDYYLLGEVHILGFGFDYSEIDLWWLQSKKASLGRAQGETFYYDLNPESSLLQKESKSTQKAILHNLLKVLKVRVISTKVDSYEEAYRQHIQKMRDELSHIENK